MTDIPLVLRSYIKGLKTHDVAEVASAVSEDLAFVSPGRTLNKSQFLQMLHALYAAFPDWHYEHSPPEARDGFIAIKWCQWGTHSGAFVMSELEPIKATGRIVRIPEQYFFYQFRDDRISEIRPDPIPGGAPRGILEQIGIVSTTL
jgi:predicted ester cyclase